MLLQNPVYLRSRTPIFFTKNFSKMEDLNQPLDAGLRSNSSDQALQFTDSVRSDLLETAKWAMFFAVLLFIALGLLALVLLISLMSGEAAKLMISIFVLGIYAIILYYPARYYYKFSTLTRRALTYEDNEALDQAFTYLKIYYRFVGILVIVVMSLYLLALIFVFTMMSNRSGFPG